MRNPIRTFSLIAVLALTGLWPAEARAQSLADVARKEEARRKTVKGEAKVYTNEDLVRRDGAAPLPAAAAAPAGATTPEKGAADPNAGAGKPAAAADGKGEQVPGRNA